MLFQFAQFSAPTISAILTSTKINTILPLFFMVISICKHLTGSFVAFLTSIFWSTNIISNIDICWIFVATASTLSVKYMLLWESFNKKQAEELKCCKMKNERWGLKVEKFPLSLFFFWRLPLLQSIALLPESLLRLN